MLRDVMRCDSYRAAFDAMGDRLQGATVMDIGTGSGLLAMLAARAGAKKVYAIEASPEIAEVASRLVRSNGLTGTVEIVPKLLENVTEEDVPSQSVDVIVSELMSHMWVGETGLQVVTLAKKRFLREGGLVLPAVAALKLSLFEEPALGAELRGRHSFWQQRDFMGFDLSAALPLAVKQQYREVVCDVVDPDSLLVPPASSPAYVIDMVTPDDPEVWNTMKFELEFPRREKGSVIDGVCGWWDAIFEGAGEQAPVLSTAPDAPPTVWAQCRFMLETPVPATATARLTIACELRLDKVRESYTMRLELRNHSTGASSKAGPFRLSDVYARHLAQSVPFPAPADPTSHIPSAELRRPLL